MGVQLFTNNADSTLAAPVSSVALSIQVATGDGAKFPSPSGTDWFMLTLLKRLSGVEYQVEIVKVTARSGDILTIVRAQDGTTAQTYTTGDIASLRMNAGWAGRAVTTDGATMNAALNSAATVTIASAGTVAIGAAASNELIISGTTTITAFDSIAAGARRFVQFSGALTLTHNGTSLILPGAANITTVAGDSAEFVSLGSGNWRCTNYHKASVTGTGSTVLATSPTIATPTLTAPTIDAINGGTVSGTREKIINGRMEIDQMVNGTVTTNGVLIVDRFILMNGGITGKINAAKNQGAITPPPGFSTYIGATTTLAYTPTSTDRFGVRTNIEGFGLAELAWGTASARPATISFWVNSSLTGTFGGGLFNNGGTRNYAFTYTVSAANTWERKTVLIAPDTTGTWLSDNGAGVYIVFSLGVAQQLAAGSWTASTGYTCTGETQIVATLGATWKMTGASFKAGDCRNELYNEWRPHPHELALCQRYYQRLQMEQRFYAAGAVHSMTATRSPMVPMRATPTFALVTAGTLVNASAATLAAVSNQEFQSTITSTAAGDCYVTGRVYETSGADL